MKTEVSYHGGEQLVPTPNLTLSLDTKESSASNEARAEAFKSAILGLPAMRPEKRRQRIALFLRDGLCIATSSSHWPMGMMGTRRKDIFVIQMTDDPFKLGIS